MGILKEFREFAMRGSVVDLAVGVIIGGAFGKIVSSVVEDVIMPIVGIAGKADFSNLYLPLKEPVRRAVEAAGEQGLSLAQARAIGPVLAYGNFITVTINFIIVAFCIFMVIKAMNTAKKRFEKEKEAAPPPPPSREVVLLTEIRDALRAR
jgi:large conductance mechanosensitive channel